MLNIKELEQKFDAMLDALTKEDLENWLSFYQERKILEKLKQGSVVTIAYNVPTVINIEQIDMKALFVQRNSPDNTQYAMAA